MSVSVRSIVSVLSAAALVITVGPAGPHASATFPGGNGKIAFVSNRDGADIEVYSMNQDGTAQTRLTETPGRPGSPPMRSSTAPPNGRPAARRSPSPPDAT
jgi:hypothetical protein